MSYNGLASLLIFLSAAIVISALPGPQPSRVNIRSTCCILGLAGFLAGLSFFAKFSSALVFVVVVTVVLLVTFGRLTAVFLPALSMGCAVAAGFYFSVLESFQLWRGNFLTAVSLESSGSHDLSYVLFNLCFPAHLAHVPVVIACFVMVFACALMFNRNPHDPKRRKWLIPLAVCWFGGLAGLSTIGYFHGHESNMALLALISEAAILLSIAVTARGGQSLKIDNPRLAVVTALLLVLLPFIASFGTNTDLIGHTSSNMAPWFLLIALLSVVIARHYRATGFVAVVLVPLSLYFLVGFINGYVFKTRITGTGY